ncbi:MAG TPA: DUF1080 domain-containing protein [Longimicrobiales bacterium]|nr:DUF1080 domain-containing protein [Longimicrobiales bacterium]
MKTRRVLRPCLVALLMALVPGCAPAGEADAASDTADAAAESQEAMNTLTAQERAEGWRLLFDGASLDQWRGFRQETLPGGWVAQDGMLIRTEGGGDIITRDVFQDFELSLEWMVHESGNSGVMFRVSEEAERTFHSAPEMQILDDAGHVDGGNPLTSAGANYAMHPAPRGVVHPAGEWNRARLRVEGNQVTHWLNGQQIVDYELGSDDWNHRLAESKFTEWPEYGTFPEGHIALQDHGDWVAFRNIKIRELN